MKKDYTPILLRMSMVLLTLLLIAIFIIDINISIEFLIIIGLIFILPFPLIIVKLMSDMKSKEKENESLEKLSDTYIKNKNIIFKKFKIVIALYIFFEVVLYIYNYTSLQCMCGHHEFKTIPMLVYIILQNIFNLYYFRRLKNKEYTVNNLNNYIISSFVIFLIVMILSKNDMDKLHSPLQGLLNIK